MKIKSFIPLVLLLWLTFFFSCSKEDPQDENIRISENAIEVNFGETYPLSAEFRRDGYSPDQLLWSSSKPEVAGVENGLVKGERAGEAVITVQTSDNRFSAKSDVIVHPTNFLFVEPLVDFRRNREFIKTNETRSFLGEDEEFLYFDGENETVLLVAYWFIDQGYQEGIIILETSDEVLDEAADFLLQRYEVVEFNETAILFSNSGYLVLLMLHPELGLTLVYLEDNGSTSPGARLKRAHRLLDNLNSLTPISDPGNFKLNLERFK